MTQITVTYEGNLSTRAEHSDNGAELRTDAPKELQGLGTHFSPTDLLATALGSCLLTIMGLAAKRLNLDIKGMKAVVVKEMTSTLPRRFGKVKIAFTCPCRPSDEEIAKLLEAAGNCAVHKSLHPDIITEFTYQWGSPK